jgi:hypothetical protein
MTKSVASMIWTTALLVLVFSSYVMIETMLNAKDLNGTVPQAGNAMAHETPKAKTRSHARKNSMMVSCTNAAEKIRDVPYRQCPKNMRLQYSNEGGLIAANPLV